MRPLYIALSVQRKQADRGIKRRQPRLSGRVSDQTGVEGRGEQVNTGRESMNEAAYVLEWEQGFTLIRCG